MSGVCCRRLLEICDENVVNKLHCNLREGGSGVDLKMSTESSRGVVQSDILTVKVPELKTAAPADVLAKHAKTAFRVVCDGERFCDVLHAICFTKSFYNWL